MFPLVSLFALTIWTLSSGVLLHSVHMACSQYLTVSVYKRIHRGTINEQHLFIVNLSFHRVSYYVVLTWIVSWPS